MRVRVWKDLQNFYKDDRRIDVRDRDIRFVLDACIRVHESCGLLNVTDGSRVSLCSDVCSEFDSMELQNTLWWFLGSDSAGKLLSNEDMTALLARMWEMDMSPELMLQILEKLLSAKRQESVIRSAVTMLVKHDFERYEQLFRAMEKCLDEYGYPDMYQEVKIGDNYYRGSMMARAARWMERAKRDFSWSDVLQGAVYWLCVVILFFAVFWATNKYWETQWGLEQPGDKPSITETVEPSEEDPADPDHVAPI